MVGNKHCSYGLCNSDARYSHKDHMKGVYFIPFPKPERNFSRCQDWVRACGRAEFTIANIKRNSYICSKHFVDEKGPTVENPDPIPFKATDAEIHESETRGRVGRSHRKRVNQAISSPQTVKQGQAVDGNLSTSQYYTLVTLPDEALTATELQLSSSQAPNVSTSTSKLLLISQPQSAKTANKQIVAVQQPLVHSVVGNNTAGSQGEQNSPRQSVAEALTTSGGQIVAVKNFVIHGQKYTAVHINPDGKEVAKVKSPANIRPRKKAQLDSGNGIFITKNNVTVAVPSAWCVQQDANAITFRKVSQNDSVLLSLIYRDTGELVLRVLGLEITSHPVLECLPSPIKMSDISFMLKQFERWRVCVGNPDEKFQTIFHQRPKSSAFYSWIDDSVHSKTCELLCLKERCTPCKNYRGYLRCILNREQKKLGKEASAALTDKAVNDSGDDQMSD